VRVVRLLEKDGQGLNLTFETIDGIRCHTGDKAADTLEGRIVHLTDRIAYINHDIDDAIRAGILTEDDIPASLRAQLGDSHSARINTLVFAHVYTNPVAKGEEIKAKDIPRKIGGVCRGVSAGFSGRACAPARNPIEDVVSQYVQLSTKKGSNLFGLCPFHGEKTASFSVAPDKQIYYCFGCHKGGGVVNFIMEIENLGYADAVRFLAKRAGLEVPEDERLRARVTAGRNVFGRCARTQRVFSVTQLLGEAGRKAREYIAGSGAFTAQTVNALRFRLRAGRLGGAVHRRCRRRAMRSRRCSRPDLR
jgi:hypothetical protein